MRIIVERRTDTAPSLWGDGSRYRVWLPEYHSGNPTVPLLAGEVGRRYYEFRSVPLEFVPDTARLARMQPQRLSLAAIEAAALQAVAGEETLLEGVTLWFRLEFAEVGVMSSAKLLRPAFEALAEALAQHTPGSYPGDGRRGRVQNPAVWREVDNHYYWALQVEGPAPVHYFRRFVQAVDNLLGGQVRHAFLSSRLAGVYAPNRPGAGTVLRYDSTGLPVLEKGGWCEVEVEVTETEGVEA